MARKKAIKSGPIELPPVLPCPCCGEGRAFGYDPEAERAYGIYVGCTHAMGVGIKCASCRLNLSLDLPDEFPAGVRGMRQLYLHTIRRAIEAWNRRAATTAEPLVVRWGPPED